MESIYRHTDPKDIIVNIVAADETSAQEALSVSVSSPVILVHPKDAPKSRIHGAMLDAYLKDVPVETPIFGTMDSDCFPIRSGWLDEIKSWLGKSALAGILHPWAPPPADLDNKKVEWRVRSQHCWRNTHVACQFLKIKTLECLGVSYAGGDDTGLLIPSAISLCGRQVSGFMPTRCAAPRDDSDPEFNRYVCVVYGDSIYHHGGYTRVTVGGDSQVMEDAYSWVLPKIIQERGAEFLLSDQFSYRYSFDREEEVAKEKMARLFGMERSGKRLAT